MSEKQKPGERGFSIFLLVVGILALIESIRMFMKEPTSSSFGALPLFLSGFMVLFMLKIIIFEDSKLATENKRNFKELFNTTIKYILPKDVVVVFFLLLLYCLLLVFGLGFEISSSLFLVTAMTYLMRGHFLKNIIYTIVSMTFILVVFKTIFQVILP